MYYYCKLEKKDSTYVITYPDIPKIQISAATQEKALALAKKKLDRFLEAEMPTGRPIPEPKCTTGHPVRIANHIAVAIQLRELRGTQSQTSVAKKLGLTYQAYQRLENPKRANPTVKTLEKIAQVFGRELSVVFG